MRLKGQGSNSAIMILIGLLIVVAVVAAVYLLVLAPR